VLGIQPQHTASQHTPQTVYNLEVQGQHVFRVTSNGLLVHNTCAPKTALRYKLGPNDVDWRGTGKTVTDALDNAFAKTGHARSDFNVTKWGKDKWGKSHPVEWRHKSGAEVNVDWPHAHNGPDAPHVGWQTGGKRGAGGAVRGHTILDEVPFNRPTIR